MLNKTYRILKYIQKNPGVSKTTLAEKFPDFCKYEPCISGYAEKTCKNESHEDSEMENLILKAVGLGMDVSSIDEYVKSNMPSAQQPTADSSIVYSTTLKFDEYREQRIRNLFLFLVPYAITTAIAIASILVQILV